MDKGQIKRQASIERVLAHYGCTPDEKDVFRCPFPENHNNGDAKPSGKISKGRAFCNSQTCFGEKGADIFEVVGLMESLPTFREQKAWLEATFGLTNGKPQKNKIIRAFEWTDAQGRVAYHLRLDDEQ